MKVIVLKGVSEEDVIKDKPTDVRLMLDMVMMAHTNTSKERTLKETFEGFSGSGLQVYVLFM